MGGSQLVSRIIIGHCTRCGRPVRYSDRVWLERNSRTNSYHYEVDPRHSQGGFLFGSDCAQTVVDNNGVCLYKGERK